MSKGVSVGYIEDYIRSLIGEHSSILKHLEDYAEENSIPIVQREVARFLELLIDIKKPDRILELGTAIGYSSILMSLGCKNKGHHITTIERDANMVRTARKNIEKCGLENNIDVIEGDCMEQISQLDCKYDLIFIDAGKGHYNHFLPKCLELLEKDGIIVADNVLFRGMIACDELIDRRKITIVKRMRKYLEMISDDKKFITSVIPMGDGISITIRRS
ncbi:MAG: O-methyltransferase [Clostridium sp.]|uniref:O-methyltransferase n=1 Tax=Clostridium sp. TaxID=1506 RepID=UPI0025BFD7DF|nr:O-methyltransferase [Clostridium sp.]MCH3964084.1 O-methyltransferase [Clostridium sp.]MCI1716285.1 O-methyltransferase [Clostridium sp.]MCI1800475.1 O-methyltransferase [Clostridium sp.]MCI1814462.1 O-methyltransferase [Clostridium sp.]MCI1871361.1 O-methyltransferase [Clostridium sp.]